MPLAAIVQHGEAVIIALHKNTDDGGDPSYERNKGKDKKAYEIHRLPEAVTDGQLDAAAHIRQHLVPLEAGFLAIDKGFRLLAEIDEDGGADDQEQVFKKGKIKEKQHQPYHDLAHHEEEAQRRAVLAVQPFGYTDELAELVNGGIGGFKEKIHTHHEHYGIDDTRDKDPFPQFVLTYKMMGLNVGLESYNDLL